MSVPTWRDLRESLPAGLTDDTIELIRRRTAPARHEARVLAAAEAALDYVGDATTEGDHYAEQQLCDMRKDCVIRVREGRWPEHSESYAHITSGAHAWGLRAAVVLLLEHNGIGGTLDLGGGRTARMSWATGATEEEALETLARVVRERYAEAN